MASRPADYVFLRSDVCTSLAALRRHPGSISTPAVCLEQEACVESALRYAGALAVLAHESQHLRGVKVEAVAECYGRQTVPQAARAFGLDEAQAAFLAAVSYRVQYPRMPAEYRSPECVPGGALDLAGVAWLR